MLLKSTDECWRQIRALRHKPPANAGRGERRLVFASATKQAEQLFRLSDQAGYESKPLLLYYGLNQATRAVSAALSDSSEKRWKLSGHGITCPNLDQNPSLGDLCVVDEGTSRGFQRIAHLANSPSLPERVSLRQLWLSTPEGAKVPLAGSDALWPAAELAAVRVDGRFPDPNDRLLHPSSVTVVELRGLPFKLGGATTRGELADLLLQVYPRSFWFEPTATDEDTPVQGRNHMDYERRDVALAISDRIERAAINRMSLASIMTLGYSSYAGKNMMRTFLTPVMPGNDSPLAPIVAWWAILYALSMLARYQPSNWSKLLDLDASSDASAVEYVLDESHSICANLILNIFESVRMDKWIDGFMTMDADEFMSP